MSFEIRLSRLPSGFALRQSLGPRGAKSPPLGNLLGLGGCIFRYIPPLGSVRIQCCGRQFITPPFDRDAAARHWKENRNITLGSFQGCYTFLQNRKVNLFSGSKFESSFIIPVSESVTLPCRWIGFSMSYGDMEAKVNYDLVPLMNFWHLVLEVAEDGI